MSSKDDVDTNVTCPVCKTGKIMAKIGEISYEPSHPVLDGPINCVDEDYEPPFTKQVKGFYCGNREGCWLQFEGVPGRPNAAEEIIKPLRTEHNTAIEQKRKAALQKALDARSPEEKQRDKEADEAFKREIQEVLGRTVELKEEIQMLRDTQVPCKVCNAGTIIAEITSVPNRPSDQMPSGVSSSSRQFYDRVIVFYCSNCCVLVKHPPGQPNAKDEILEQIGREEQAAKLQPIVLSPEAKQAIQEVVEKLKRDKEDEKAKTQLPK